MMRASRADQWEGPVCCSPPARGGAKALLAASHPQLAVELAPRNITWQRDQGRGVTGYTGAAPDPGHEEADRPR